MVNNETHNAKLAIAFVIAVLQARPCALGLPALFVLGVRVGWSFGFRDGFSAGQRERRQGR